MNTNKNKKQSSLTNTCQQCKKKSIILVNCSCSDKFCITCRMPEAHNCSFDFLKQSREQLMKDNPQVIGTKIEKI